MQSLQALFCFAAAGFALEVDAAALRSMRMSVFDQMQNIHDRKRSVSLDGILDLFEQMTTAVMKWHAEQRTPHNAIFPESFVTNIEPVGSVDFFKAVELTTEPKLTAMEDDKGEEVKSKYN